MRFHLGPTSPEGRRNSPIDRYLFADRLERRRLLVLVLLVTLLLLVTLVAYRNDDHPPARLVVLRSGVWRAIDLQHRPVLGTQPVKVGEVIRTDRGGRAQLDYFDGSVTHVDSHTSFKVIDLIDRPDRRTIAGKLDDGRIWNRVQAITRTQDRFEVRIPNAWVSARGTSNVIDCRQAPECTVIGISDTTEVAVDGGEVELLDAGECTTIDGDGKTRDCTYPREQLCSDEFTLAGLAGEGLSSLCTEPIEQDSPTPTPTPTPSPESPDQPPAPTEAPTPEPSLAPTSSPPRDEAPPDEGPQE